MGVREGEVGRKVYVVEKGAAGVGMAMDGTTVGGEGGDKY